MVFWVVLGVIRLMELFYRYAVRFLKGFTAAGTKIFSTVPLVWKTAAVFAAVAFVEFIAVMAFRRDTDMLIITWVLLHGAIFAGVIYIALCLRRLQKGGEALAAGDLSYWVDTKGMLPTFKAY